MRETLKIFLTASILLSVITCSCTATKPNDNTSGKATDAGVLAEAFSSPLSPLTLDQIVAHSDLIINGYTSDYVTRWDNVSHGIYRYYTLNVRNWVKGSPEVTKIIMRVPGGTIDNITMSVSDGNYMTKFDGLMFLEKNDDGTVAQIAGYPVGTGMSSADKLIAEVKAVMARQAEQP